VPKLFNESMRMIWAFICTKRLELFFHY